MANDMSITINALPAKGSGKEVHRSTETQSFSSSHGFEPVSKKQPVEDTVHPGRISSATSAVPKEELEGAVSQMKDFAQKLSRELQFDVDEELGRTVIRVVDKDSGNLIRQIPSDEILTLAKHMKEMSESEEGRLGSKNLREQSVGLLVKLQA